MDVNPQPQIRGFLADKSAESVDFWMNAAADSAVALHPCFTKYHKSHNYNFLSASLLLFLAHKECFFWFKNTICLFNHINVKLEFFQ